MQKVYSKTELKRDCKGVMMWRLQLIDWYMSIPSGLCRPSRPSRSGARWRSPRRTTPMTRSSCGTCAVLRRAPCGSGLSRRTQLRGRT
eukprot:9280411-Alexandrium_andersonii.AAC.1